MSECAGGSTPLYWEKKDSLDIFFCSIMSPSMRTLILHSRTSDGSSVTSKVCVSNNLHSSFLLVPKNICLSVLQLSPHISKLCPHISYYDGVEALPAFSSILYLLLSLYHLVSWFQTDSDHHGLSRIVSWMHYLFVNPQSSPIRSILVKMIFCGNIRLSSRGRYRVDIPTNFDRHHLFPFKPLSRCISLPWLKLSF